MRIPLSSWRKNLPSPRGGTADGFVKYAVSASGPRVVVPSGTLVRGWGDGGEMITGNDEFGCRNAGNAGMLGPVSVGGSLGITLLAAVGRSVVLNLVSMSWGARVNVGAVKASTIS